MSTKSTSTAFLSNITIKHHVLAVMFAFDIPAKLIRLGRITLSKISGFVKVGRGLPKSFNTVRDSYAIGPPKIKATMSCLTAGEKGS